MDSKRKSGDFPENEEDSGAFAWERGRPARKSALEAPDVGESSASAVELGVACSGACGARSGRDANTVHLSNQHGLIAIVFSHDAQLFRIEN